MYGDQDEGDGQKQWVVGLRHEGSVEGFEIGMVDVADEEGESGAFRPYFLS